MKKPFLFALRFVALLVLAAGSARAATLTVTTAANAGPGSLRQTVADAAPGDTIVFAAALAGQIIFLIGDEIVLDKDVTIDASALLPGGITLDGNADFLNQRREADEARIFVVANGVTARLRGLSVRRGKADYDVSALPLPPSLDNAGGGIFNRGQLTLEQCLLGGGVAEYGAALYNDGGSVSFIQCTIGSGGRTNLSKDWNFSRRLGIIYNDNGGTLNFIRSFIGANNEMPNVAGIYNNGGSVTFTESTIDSLYIKIVRLYTENAGVDKATLDSAIRSTNGGAVTVARSTIRHTGTGCIMSGGGALHVIQSTITTNGTGIYTEGGVVNLTQSTVSGNGTGIRNIGDGTLHLIRSIVAGNSVTNVSGSIATDDHNLLSGNPLLTPASSGYGGPTPTMHPLPGSPAIDAGGTSDPGFATDQRGFPRVLGAAVDIGAVEYDPAAPPTIIVENLKDAGVGSLRSAIAAAVPGTPITFLPALSGQTLDLATGQIVLDKEVTIDASALPGGFAISGTTLFDTVFGEQDLVECRIFEVTAGATVRLRGLQLVNGKAFDPVASGEAFEGGAVRNAGNLTVEECVVSGGRANSGGGIYNAGGGSLTLLRSTLLSNSSVGGGGIYNNGGTVAVTQSTVAGNGSLDVGGGILNESGTVTLTQATVSGNLTSFIGGGIANVGGTLHLTRSIVAGNTGGNVSGPIATDVNNLLSGDPLLAPPGEYGGPTPTRPPLPGSPAVDAGGTATPGFATDQRGLPRVIGAAVDIGAVEYNPAAAPFSLVVQNVNDSGPGSLRAAIADSPVGGGVIFAPALSGQTITLGGTQIVLDKALVIDATDLPGGIRISGNSDGNGVLNPGESRVFQVSAGTAVALRGLRLISGQVSTTIDGPAGWGGAILNSGALTLDRCHVASSRALAGGGIYNSGGTLTLTRSTLSGNSALEGGGLYNLGPLAARQSTFSGNNATYGGAFYNFAAAAVTFEHCTVSANFAGNGGGINNEDGGTLHLTRSIVAGNSGGNFVGGLDTDVNNLLSGNPLLAPLGDYGGPTPTMPPLPGSPAIDAAAIDPLLTTDQRGFARPNGPLPDIGAVEAYPFSLLNLPDTDSDGIPDILEGPGGPYPQFTVGIDDSTLDSDGDGSPDAAELANMTDPHNPNDYFRLLAFTSAGLSPESNPLFDVTWKSFPGLAYTIVAKTDLNFAASSHAFAPVTATNFTHTLRVELDRNNPQDFIRVRRD